MAAKRLRVHANPVLRAAVTGAVQLTSTTGQKRWNKDDGGRSRIDVLVALTMAVGAAEVGLENLTESDRVTTKRDHVRNFYRQYTTGSAADGLTGLHA